MYRYSQRPPCTLVTPLARDTHKASLHDVEQPPGYLGTNEPWNLSNISKSRKYSSRERCAENNTTNNDALHNPPVASLRRSGRPLFQVLLPRIKKAPNELQVKSGRGIP